MRKTRPTTRRRFIDSNGRRPHNRVVYFIRIFFFSVYGVRPINFESIIIMRRAFRPKYSTSVVTGDGDVFFFYIWPKRVSPSGRNDDRSHLRLLHRIYVVSFFSFTTTVIFIFSSPLCFSVAAGNSSSSSININ